MKKKYTSPTIEITLFESEDVLCASGFGSDDGSGNDYGGGEITPSDSGEG